MFETILTLIQFNVRMSKNLNKNKELKSLTSDSHGMIRSPTGWIQSLDCIVVQSRGSGSIFFSFARTESKESFS